MGTRMAAIRDEGRRVLAARSAGSVDTPIAVFFHGLGGHRFSWEPQLRALAGFRRCVACDLPGYGDSPGLPASLPTVAAVAAQWIADIGGGPVDVVGLSFGGMVAQHLALDYPELVRTLALLDTSPAFGMDGDTTPEAWMASRVKPARTGGISAQHADGIIANLVGKDCPTDVRASAAAAIQAVPAATLTAACRALVQHDTRTRLHHVHIPTLVMVGAEDTETPPSYAEALAALIPNATLAIVSGAGHLLNLEAPDNVNEALRRFWLLGGEATT